MTSQKKSPVGAGLNSNANVSAAQYTQPASVTLGDPLHNVLSRLQRVRQTGPGRYVASCPVPDHGQGKGDRNPSFIIWERPDGSVGIKCFGGCGFHESVAAMGLQVRDLYPRRETPANSNRPGLPAWKRRKLQEAAEHERLIRRVALADLKAGRVLPEADIQRAELAQQRLQTIEEVLRHAR